MTHDSQFAGPVSPIPVLSVNQLGHITEVMAHDSQMAGV